jgi:hypothetical protein
LPPQDHFLGARTDKQTRALIPNARVDIVFSYTRIVKTAAAGESTKLWGSALVEVHNVPGASDRGARARGAGAQGIPSEQQPLVLCRGPGAIVAADKNQPDQ